MCYRRMIVQAMLIVFLGLLSRPSAQTAPPAKSLPPRKTDPEAARLIEETIKTYDPRQTGWLQMDLWQQGDLQGLKFVAQGDYVTGPRQQLRVDLQVAVAGAEGRLEMISDGTTFWEVLQIGTGPRTVLRKIELKKVLEAIDSRPLTAAEVQDDFLQSNSFAGLTPLLRALQKRMLFAAPEKNSRWNGHDVIRLTGSWSPDVLRQAPPAQQAPAQPWPRKCVIYLDAKTAWPYRIEWWGATPLRAAEFLLFQMEFRNPRYGLKQTPPPAERFTFDPGTAEVLDRTQAEIESLNNLARQLEAHPTAK